MRTLCKKDSPATVETSFESTTAQPTVSPRLFQNYHNLTEINRNTNKQAPKQTSKRHKQTKTLWTQSSPVGSSPRRVRFLLSKNADKHNTIAILRVAFPRNFSRGKATQHSCECRHLTNATIKRHQTPLYVNLNDHILLREPHFVSIQDWCLSLFADYRIKFQKVSGLNTVRNCKIHKNVDIPRHRCLRMAEKGPWGVLARNIMCMSFIMR